MPPAPDADVNAPPASRGGALSPVAHRAEDRPVLLTDPRVVGDDVVYVTAGDTIDDPTPAPTVSGPPRFRAVDLAWLGGVLACTAAASVLVRSASDVSVASTGAARLGVIAAHAGAAAILWLLGRRFSLSSGFAALAVALWVASPLVATTSAQWGPAAVAAPFALGALLLAMSRTGDHAPVIRAVAVAGITAVAVSLSPGTLLLAPATAYALWHRTPPIERERHLIGPGVLLSVVTIGVAWLSVRHGWPASAWGGLPQPVGGSPHDVLRADPILPLLGVGAAVAALWQRSRVLGVGVLSAEAVYLAGLHVADVATAIAPAALLIVSVPVVVVTRARAPHEARPAPGAFAAPPDLRPRRAAATGVRALAGVAAIAAVVGWAHPWQRLLASDSAPTAARPAASSPRATNAPSGDVSAPRPTAAAAVPAKAVSTGALELARNPSLTLGEPARTSLAAGLVDDRMLAELVLLLDMHPLRVEQFLAGPSDPAGSELRTAVITAIGPASPRPGGPVTSRFVATLRAQRPPFAVESVDVTGGRLVFTVAPGPAPAPAD